mmetsp:Transcript_30626/g.37838  ORF Transcript_30626/g.37838 Transcript_30626/m.37838 type:complete len:152 (+) Transcript_30626:1471-1926(+)
MLGDREGSKGKWSWCGATCSRHSLKISSEVAQTVYVTAHSWEKRSYPEECQHKNLVHSIYLEGDTTVYTFRNGARGMAPIEFGAMETKNFVVEWDFARKDITTDWSVTVWASEGRVAIQHSKDIPTATLAFTPRYNAQQTPVAQSLHVDAL